MGVRQLIRDGVTGTARTMAHKGLQFSSKSLARTSQVIQNLKSRVDQKAENLSSATTSQQADNSE